MKPQPAPIPSPLPQGFDDLARASDELTSWLVERAAPLWEEIGVDRLRGGFFEEIIHGPDAGTPRGTGHIRRGRVVARQIYSFATARRLGWQPRHSDPVEHGTDYLFGRLRGGHGLFLTAVAAESYEAHGVFSLYEHAFYLFALAHISRASSVWPVADSAHACLRSLRETFGRPFGGFEESDPPAVPLRSNPHMHLLEAALAWLDVPDAAGEWRVLARELVLLCLDRFIDPHSGGLPELFDFEWRPVSDGAVIEPGHQFEWAWLLLRWAALPQSTAEERRRCRGVAARLIEIGEAGVDPARGVVINALNADLYPKESDAKLWPQTERIKAWCKVLGDGPADAAWQMACERVVAALHMMSSYFLVDRPGLWHEVSSADGRFLKGPTKASSFYHIVAAIDVLRTTVSEYRAR